MQNQIHTTVSLDQVPRLVRVTRKSKMDPAIKQALSLIGQDSAVKLDLPELGVTLGSLRSKVTDLAKRERVKGHVRADGETAYIWFTAS